MKMQYQKCDYAGRLSRGRKQSFFGKMFLFLGFLFLFAAIASAAHDAPIVRLQLYYSHDFLFAGYYAAEQKGYFHDYNLDVRFIAGNVTTDIGQEIDDHGYELGISSLDGLKKARQEGHDIKAVAAIFQKIPFVFTVLANSTIKSPQDFRRRTIGVKSDLVRSVVLGVLENAGISPSEVYILPVGEDTDHLYNGTIDVFAGSSFDVPIKAELMDYPIRVFSAGNYGISDHDGLIVASSELIRQHPERVRRFVEASLKGWKYVMDSPIESARYVLIYNQNYSLKHAERAATRLPSFLFHQGQYGCISNEHQNIDPSLYDNSFVQERCGLIHLEAETANITKTVSFVAFFIALVPAGWFFWSQNDRRKKEVEL
ncbi:ABC transporter substrate-binding protein [Candidatus Woesearchaeota archaeon]|nr:ABC transporter substrate-binding protein [Candidatus Woesearchaeota archaeon]